MNRLHLHVKIDDLARSIEFYSTLFGAPPTVKEDNYAKWRLDDPAVNLAISVRSETEDLGIDHVGIDSASPAALGAISDRLTQAGEATRDQVATQCCYAVSDKTWTMDPSGVRWETFFSHGAAPIYGEDAARAALGSAPSSEPAGGPTQAGCCAV